MLKGEILAADLDCVIDLDDPPFEGVAAPPPYAPGLMASVLPLLSADQIHALATCLALRRDPDLEGSGAPLLNCFVRVGGVVFAPNRISTWWDPSPEGVSIWDKGLPTVAK